MHKNKAFVSNPDKRRCVQVSDPATAVHVEKNNSDKHNGTPKERLLAKRKQKLQELLQSAREGDTVTIQKIAAEGFNLNMQDDEGWTALHCAAKAKQDKVVELLIKLGVNQGIRNNIGQTCQDIITETSIEECF